MATAVTALVRPTGERPWAFQLPISVGR